MCFTVILYELFKFISPALLENEKYSTQVLFIVYVLFIVGVMMSYFILSAIITPPDIMYSCNTTSQCSI